MVGAVQPPAPGDTRAPLLELRGIRKQFDGVVAVDDVSFDVRAGEVHALLGENGAGKSTLVKVGVGYHQPDTGTVLVAGEERHLSSTRDAEAAGIAMIPQELDQFPDLSVAEQLFVGRSRPRTRWGGIDRRAMERTARDTLARMGVSLDVRAAVRQLSVANRQLVAIARALVNQARVVIMDEPTGALSEREAERLFTIVRELTAAGVGIVYISHRLEEVFAISDRITVLRDGQHIATRPTASLDAEELVRLMVGRPLSELFSRHPGEPGAPALEVRGLTLPGRFEDVSFTAHRGEVLGLAGLIGAGRTEVARAIFGVDTPAGGEVLIDGERVTIRHPADAMARGIAYVPEERQSQGLVLDFPIAHNISLSSLGSMTRRGLVDRRRERELAERFAGALTIRGAALHKPVSSLSGGNQQKVVVSKALAREPEIILLDEPTRGIDVGAKSEIYELIDDLAAQGKAIVLISSELLEVLALSDRIVVMREGRVEGELSRDEATQESVMTLATGAEFTASAEAIREHIQEQA